MEFHVSGALEFFKNQVIHPAVSFNERGAKNREAPAFLDIAGRTEKPSGRGERLGIDAAAHRPPFFGLQVVVSAGHAGDGIEKDDDVFPQLDQALSGLDLAASRHLCAAVSGQLVTDDLEALGLQDVDPAGHPPVVLEGRTQTMDQHNRSGHGASISRSKGRRRHAFNS